MANLIQMRRDTLANWTSNNPILANGEIAFVTDENKLKIGNGVNTFSALSYISGGNTTESFNPFFLIGM